MASPCCAPVGMRSQIQHARRGQSPCARRCLGRRSSAGPSRRCTQHASASGGRRWARCGGSPGCRSVANTLVIRSVAFSHEHSRALSTLSRRPTDSLSAQAHYDLVMEAADRSGSAQLRWRPVLPTQHLITAALGSDQLCAVKYRPPSDDMRLGTLRFVNCTRSGLVGNVPMCSMHCGRR